MKFYFSQIGRLFELIKAGKIRALLLYGPDKGYIEKICKHLVKSLNMLQTSIEYSDLNISSLEILLNSPNFFGQKELIKIRSVGNSIDKNLKTILSSDYINFPVFIGEEITSGGSVRKFFETEEYLAAVACYHDDEAKIERIILGKVKKTNKIISKEAITYLKAHLKGDHDLICSEINKLIYFVHDRREITLNDVLKVISSEITANGSDLAMYFSKKDYSNFLQELEILKKQNINEVLIIRALIRHYLNLYIVLSKVKSGESLELAIKSLSPPIFYQYINDFTKIANSLSLTECLETLKLLQQAEVDYKLNPAGFDLFQSSIYYMPRPDFSDPDKQIHEIIRVNHAGEYGAKRIYQGQLKYIKSQNDHILIKEMLDHEEVHLNYFEKKLLEKEVRPTFLLFFWHHYGFLLGALSSLMGIKTVMLVTESVEEVIEKHYEQQINYLENKNIEPELLNNIIKFRLDEIEHKNIAIMNDSTEAVFAEITSKIVKIICRISIISSKKI